MVNDWLKISRLKKQQKKARARVQELSSSSANSEDIVAAAREVERFEAAIEQIRTQQIITQVIKLGLDLPPFTHEWYYSRRIYEPDAITTVTSLTPLGKTKLQRRIRIEKRERAAFWLQHIPSIIGALTGLLGVLVAILALILSSNKS